MADTEGSSPAVSASTAASPKKKNPKPKKSRPVANHPKIADMVNAAISNLKERGGSSLQAIKKYIASNYKVDVEKLAPFIKKYLKTAVTNGALIQAKGKGASGSFKLSATTKSDKKKAPVKAKKPEKKVVKKAAAEKRVAKPKKRMEKKTATKAKKSEKKESKPKKAKTQKKEKKAKAPKKPKSPKPKKSPAKKTARK